MYRPGVDKDMARAGVSRALLLPFMDLHACDNGRPHLVTGLEIRDDGRVSCLVLGARGQEAPLVEARLAAAVRHDLSGYLEQVSASSVRAALGAPAVGGEPFRLLRLALEAVSAAPTLEELRDRQPPVVETIGRKSSVAPLRLLSADEIGVLADGNNLLVLHWLRERIRTIRCELEGSSQNWAVKQLHGAWTQSVTGLLALAAQRRLSELARDLTTHALRMVENGEVDPDGAEAAVQRQAQAVGLHADDAAVLLAQEWVTEQARAAAQHRRHYARTL